MSPRRLQSESSIQETDAPFKLKEDGKVVTNWKTLLGIAGFVAALGSFYATQNDHSKRLDKLDGKVDQQHELLLEIRGAMRASAKNE